MYRRLRSEYGDGSMVYRAISAPTEFVTRPSVVGAVKRGFTMIARF